LHSQLDRPPDRSGRSAIIRSFLFLLIGLAGCPICGDGALEVVEGAVPIAPGSSIQLVFRYDGATISSPDQCGGHWYVNGVEGGDATLGTITPCGRYTAPATPPPEPPLIEAAEFPQCSDCCPYASRTITLAGGT
jgi:hypothetical protein